MIIVRIDGDLGQQLNQYGCALALGAAQGRAVRLDLGASAGLLERFTLEAQAASAGEIAAAKAAAHVRESSLLFDPGVADQVARHASVYLDGGWADYRYRQAAAARLQSGLRLRGGLEGAAGALLARIGAAASVALYLYRDAAQGAPHHVTLPNEYFDDALAQLLDRQPQAHVFLFSDDPEWAANALGLRCAHTVVPAHGQAETLELMRACRHHIASNSSLAHAAAFLADADGADITVAQQSYAPHDAALAERFGAVRQRVWPAGWRALPVRRADPTHLPFRQFKGGHNGGRPIRVAVWNFYQELTTDGFLFKNTEAVIGASLLKPWCDLHDYGRLHGIEFVTFDQVASAAELDAVIFMDRPREHDPRVAELLRADIAKYLILYECEVIKPDNWDRAYHAQFERVFTWSDVHADGRRYIKTNFAIDPDSPFDFEVLKTAFEQRKLATIIAGAKGSPHPFELYSERVRTIRWFEASAPQDFDLYGMGWKHEDFPSYRGKVSDKLSTLAQYRFMLCYENAKSIPGYITEKILDCFRAGVVPVYGGAPNIERWVPPGCFIDLRQFSSFSALHEHLAGMDQATYNGYLDRIRHYLDSRESYPFSSECFVDTVTSVLVWDVQRRRGEAPAGATLELVQDLETMEMRVVEQAAAACEPTPRASIAAASRPDLIVYLGYGDELPVFKRARALWEFYLSHFPNIKAFFVRDTTALARGEVQHNGYDLLVGIGEDGAAPGEAGYRQTGVWSAKENAGVIYKQMAVFDYVLRKYDKPFYLFHATVTSVVDFRGLLAILDNLPQTGCFAGMPGRLATPPALAGLSFICGTNSVFSRDMVELLRNRYRADDPNARMPNDIWQSITLQDVPRRSIPYFSFVKPRAMGENLDDVAEMTRRLLADGHFHFRVKTTSAEAGLGKREDVDPWVMLKIMETILASDCAPEKSRQLCAAMHACTGSGPEGFVAFPDDGFFKGERTFALTELEAPLLYPPQSA